MIRQTVLFGGFDTSSLLGLWVTNGTAAGTRELTGISGTYTGSFIGFAPSDFTVFNGAVLFDGRDASGNIDLWMTNATAASTHELTGISGANASGLFPSPLFPGFTVFNGEVLFEGTDASGNVDLWVTNGTAAGTSELTGISGAFQSGILFDLPAPLPPSFTVFNGEVLFEGTDASGHFGLWATDGTAAGTFELTGISGANSGGLFSGGGSVHPNFTAFNGKALFEGFDASGTYGLWVTNGAAAGTHELTGISGAFSGGLFDNINPIEPDFTVFNSEVLFSGIDSSGINGLWVTDETSEGTHELTGISGLFDPSDLTVFNGQVLFAAFDVSGYAGLWVTNGAAAGTVELTGISGAYTGMGTPGLSPSDLTVFNGEVLFNGHDASGNFGLWVTNGTAVGTHELTGVTGANSGSPNPGSLTPVTLVVPPADDFTGNNTSDILFINTSSGDTWFEAISNGAPRTPNPWQEIGGSDTHYAVLGVGDFYGSGASDILFRNISTGDTWFEAISNGASAGWHQIGGSDTHYSVAGVGDFSGYGTSDILFRNTSTGDTWSEAMSNGTFAGWNQIGGSDTNYSVVGVADFYGTGVDDILFRNNSTGDTWFEQMTNGASASWHQIGGSDTHYSVAGVADFFGNGLEGDILFRNNSTGDTWFEAVSNGTFAGWHQIGGSDTNYAVVGVGDYFGNNTSGILFRNSAGDTWVEAISNGAFAGWHQIGGSSTAYTVPVTVGPPALT
jgi:hypothetical protein